MSKSSAWQQDRDHFVHPYTDFTCFSNEGSQVIESGSGAHVLDDAGGRYLDAIAGLWCVNLGHGRAEIAEAMARQAGSLGYYNTFGHSTNIAAAALAAKLAELAPQRLNKVFYTTGGSTANDTAVRLAHYYFNRRGLPNKKKIISRHNAYHGSTYFAATLTGIHGSKYGFDRIAEDIVSHVSAADLYRCPKNLTEEEYCDLLVAEFEARVVQLGPDNIAAFIAEPVMGAGGVLVAPSGYHRRIHSICKAHDILYIADEVVTGFGRLGEWFASELRFGYEPDLLVTAKGLTSGYAPLGAVLISDEVYDGISKPQGPAGLLSHGFTYSGHPVACAAGLATIEIMEREDTLAHVREVGPYLQQRARTLLQNEIVGDVRGDQLMLGVELVRDRETGEGFALTEGSANRLFTAARQRGVIIRPLGNVIVVSPPLVFTRADVDQLVGVLDESIQEIAPALLGVRG